MNALAKSDATVRKAPVTVSPAATPSPKLDRYGRNPNAPGEVLRRQTNYDADFGYAPLYAAWMADLPRLSSGQVCTLFIMAVGVLSLGRPDNPKRGKRHEWTKPVTVEYLAELCRCHIRDIQRQIRDLSDRGVIAAKAKARGTYEISLLFRKWQELPDYQPARLVAIDEPEETAEDDAAPDVAAEKDAVRLVKRPLKVSAGKTGRSIRVDVGIQRMRCQNAASLPLVYDAVVHKGELIISTRLASDWRETAGEAEANGSRHGCREGEGDARTVHPRAADVIEVFDPLLQKSGGRLLALDPDATLAAAKALGKMPREFLSHWLHEVGNKPRASRPISGAKVVASIVREAAAAWSRSGGDKGAAARPGTGKAGGGSSLADSVKRAAARKLEKFGRIL